MSNLILLSVAGNISEKFKINGSTAVVKVSTTASAAVYVETSVDGVNFSTVDDVVFTVDGEKTFNLCDFTPGQFARISADAYLESVKVLA